MTTHAPTAYDVIDAALLTHVPDTAPPGTLARLVHAALVAHGHLPDPDVSIEDAARRLAALGGSPRHTQGEGWRRLLESRVDIGIAASKALSGIVTRDREAEVAALVERLHAVVPA